MADGGLNAEVVAAAAIAASAERAGPGRSGVVALNVGGAEVALDIVDGRVLRTVAPTEAGVAVPLSPAQLAALVDGSLSLAQGFMRGDIKPEGATGPLLALIELFEDEGFRQRLVAATS